MDIRKIFGKRIIDAAKACFDAQVHEYKQVHSDDKQLAKLVDLLAIRNGKSERNLGTGDG